jgi:hypothetical protein
MTYNGIDYILRPPLAEIDYEINRFGNELRIIHPTETGLKTVTKVLRGNFHSDGYARSKLLSKSLLIHLNNTFQGFLFLNE